MQHPPTRTVGFSATFLQFSTGWTRGFKTSLGLDNSANVQRVDGVGCRAVNFLPVSCPSLAAEISFLGDTKNGSAFRSPFPFTQVALMLFWIGKITGSGWENNCFWDGTAYRSGFGSGFSFGCTIPSFLSFSLYSDPPHGGLWKLKCPVASPVLFLLYSLSLYLSQYCTPPPPLRVGFGRSSLGLSSAGRLTGSWLNRRYPLVLDCIYSCSKIVCSFTASRLSGIGNPSSLFYKSASYLSNLIIKTLQNKWLACTWAT
jgi:hypothetical protein